MKEFLVAVLLTLVALLNLVSGAGAQQAQTGTPLPPVTIQPPQPPAAAPPPPQVVPAQPQAQAAPKPQAKPKRPPKPRPQTAVAPPPPPQPPPPVAEPSPATALGTYNPSLDLRDFALPPGTTLTTAGPVQGYRALSAMSATKSATPIEQIPQSIQVLPRSILDDQKPLTVSEAVQNVSNVQGPNTRSIGDTQFYPYTIRGFGAQAWLDGMVMPFSLGDRDAMANVERIEVLKGPNAILYGGGGGAPIGGAINIVSKLPTATPSGEFGITFGSHRYVQTYFDVNQPITTNGTVLFRTTGEYTGTNSFIDVLEQDRYSINPTLTLTNKTDTTLTIQGRISKSQQQAYQGLPVTGTLVGGFRADRNLFIGPADIPRSFSEVMGLTVTLDHKLSEIWSANVKARWSKGSSQQNSQLVTGFDGTGATPEIPPSTWLLVNSVLAEELEEFSINPTLTAKFRLANTKNVVLLGADYSRVTEKGQLAVDYLGSACAAFFGGIGACGFSGPTVDLNNPVFGVPWIDPRNVPQYQDFFGIDQVAMFADVKNVFTTKGIYGQLQSSIYDRLHVLAGVRLANIEMTQVDSGDFTPGTTVAEDTKLLPRIGAVFDVAKGLSVYASYSEGMRAVARFSPVGRSLPEYSRQGEAGLKFRINDQLTGTVAVFKIERDNVPVNSGFNTLLASQEAQGYEADLLWQPTRNWQVIGSYGNTVARFSDSLLGVAAGNKFPIVPEHSGRVWVNYRFDEPLLKGFSIGAGIYAASSQFVDAANLYKVDGFYTVDAKIAYDTEFFKAALHVKNLTGNEYFVPYAFLGGQVAPSDARAVYGTVAYKY